MSYSVTIDVTPDALQLINIGARGAGVSVSEYVHGLVMDGVSKIDLEQVLSAEVSE